MGRWPASDLVGALRDSIMEVFFSFLFINKTLAVGCGMCFHFYLHVISSTLLSLEENQYVLVRIEFHVVF